MAVNRNAVAGGAGNVDLHYGNADDLPYEDATFDAAFSINSMQVWPDPITGLEKLRRVLIPSGRVALGFTPIAGQSKNDVQPVVEAAGFDSLCVR